MGVDIEPISSGDGKNRIITITELLIMALTETKSVTVTLTPSLTVTE